MPPPSGARSARSSSTSGMTSPPTATLLYRPWKSTGSEPEARRLLGFRLAMERVQAVASSAAAESGGACVSCHSSAVDGPRCSHCGAAQVAGGYRALRVIAQTAHSRMYLAEDENGRKVALKELMFALV